MSIDIVLLLLYEYITFMKVLLIKKEEKRLPDIQKIPGEKEVK
jgi:hypothetical protein